jgi:hypothetical protein
VEKEANQNLEKQNVAKEQNATKQQNVVKNRVKIFIIKNFKIKLK